jgi:hypothetical protein
MSPNSLEKRSSQPTFLPRPILLRVLNHSYKNRRADVLQNQDHLFTLSSALRNFNMNADGNIVGYGPTHPTAITSAQANLISGPNFGCSNPGTNYHELNCGHAVLTSTDWPSDHCPKSACASNCKRKSCPTSSAADITKGEHPRTEASTFAPFICPNCIEVALRRNYVKVWKQYYYAGYAPAHETEVNIGTWTYCAVRALEQVGLRVAQGTSGVYIFGYEHEYKAINFVPSLVEVTRGRWSFEGRTAKRVRRRSRSPERFVDEGRGSPPTHRDDANRDQVKGTMKRYHDRSASRAEEFEIDELVGRLEDARVGLSNDEDVDVLLAGIGAMET